MWKLLCVSLILLFMQVDCFGQTAWKFITEKEGVKVYTSEVPGSKVKTVKVEAMIDATESQLLAVLMDINTSTEWEYHVKSATLVKQVSPSELYYYCEVNLPLARSKPGFCGTYNGKPGPKYQSGLYGRTYCARFCT